MFKKWRGQDHQEGDSLDWDAKVKELRTTLGPLSGRSLKFCTDACLRRYLEARNWDLNKSKKMLEETIKWRSEYKPEEIRWHEVADEGVNGKVSRANFVDRQGRSVLILRLGMQSKVSGDGKIRHLVYLMENAIFNLPENQQQMSWLLDFSKWQIGAASIPMKVVREMLHVLQNHYPERLAVVVFYNPPRIFQAFFQVLKYFIDPKSFQKVKFVYPNNKASEDLMKSLFDTENLPSELGGKGTLTYNHEEFSRLMIEDDVKTAKFWGFDNQTSHNQNTKECSEPEVVSVPSALASPAT